MKIFLMELFFLGVYNLVNYFALIATGNIKRYFKVVWPIVLFGNILIGLTIAILY